MSEFQPGEIVDVHIKGARIDSAGDNYIGFLLGGIQHGVHASAPEVTVERVAPAEWPPQLGDLWRDRHGSAWFVFNDVRTARATMIPQDPIRDQGFDPDEVLKRNGPMTLAHREAGDPA